MKTIRLKRGQSKLFWTLSFKGDNAIDIGDCHGDGALHLWKIKKGALEEAECFEDIEKAIPTRIKITVIS